MPATPSNGPEPRYRCTLQRAHRLLRNGEEFELGPGAVIVLTRAGILAMPGLVAGVGEHGAYAHAVDRWAADQAEETELPAGRIVAGPLFRVNTDYSLTPVSVEALS